MTRSDISFSRAFYELMSSMRFAISLLSLVITGFALSVNMFLSGLHSYGQL